ncbi:MAG: hypothetical protein ACXAEI_01585 [Candidatus Hodarchaeales archaeon]|jgi:hypothetical protein
MIVLCGYIDLSSGLAWEVWENEDRHFDVGMGLVGPLVFALDNFVRELTLSKRGFSEGRLEEFRMIVYQPEEMKRKEFYYILFQDLYDSVEYAHRKLDLVNELIGDYLEVNEFNPPTDLFKRAQEILKFTQKLPAGLITPDEPIAKHAISELEKKEVTFLDMFLADIDEGCICDFVMNDLIEKDPSRLFHDLLRSVELEDYLYLETFADRRVLKGLNREELYGILREGWLVLPIKEDIPTDFFLVAYFIFDQDKCSRKEIQASLEIATRDLYHKVKGEIGISPIWQKASE